MKFSKQVKQDLFNRVKLETNPFGDDESKISFLEKIWDLDQLPSTDSRYSNATQDVFQHIIRNADWDDEQLFIERFGLFSDENAFFKFVVALTLPEFRISEEEIMRYVSLINAYISKDDFKLVLKDYDDKGLPIYQISEKEEFDDLPIDIKQNKIPFFIATNLTGKSTRASSHTTPDIVPSFVLAFNSGWNDFSIKSEFHLFYYDEKKLATSIGPVKIINEDVETENTIDIMPVKFTKLKNDFCSLGQEYYYYDRLKTIFKEDFKSVLFALRDAAFFPIIHEAFEKNRKFIRSLIRFDEVERIRREVPYIVYERDMSNLYTFNYQFHPLYSDESVEIPFNFNNTSEIPNRIYALIGKNGSGKTQLLTSLPLNISLNKSDFFRGEVPIFSKYIAVSYSIFDSFELPERTAAFNYVYCGLRDQNGEQLTETALVKRFQKTWTRIEQIERTSQWRSILLNFLEKDIVNEFLIERENVTNRNNAYKVNVPGFNNIKRKLSSGQSILLYIISEITANIRLDSLLLYDEPEMHLHPNATSQLMNSIYELVNEFESYCIIATHSPLIIQEVLSRNVYVVERHETVASVRKIGLESFGENLTVLTEEVFGNKLVPKYYKTLIKTLVSKGHSFDDIVSLFESDKIPLSLNAKIYIQSIIKDSNEKS